MIFTVLDKPAEIPLLSVAANKTVKFSVSLTKSFAIVTSNVPDPLEDILTVPDGNTPPWKSSAEAVVLAWSIDQPTVAPWKKFAVFTVNVIVEPSLTEPAEEIDVYVGVTDVSPIETVALSGTPPLPFGS